MGVSPPNPPSQSMHKKEAVQADLSRDSLEPVTQEERNQDVGSLQSLQQLLELVLHPAKR